MVSDSDLAARLREILQTSDLDTTTPGSVRRQLEDEFKVDLSDRKTFVREQIDIFIRTLEKEQENVEDGNDAVGIKVEKEIQESESERELSNNVDKKVKKRGGGFNKLCSLSTQLQKLVGVPELARTEVVKKIWAYIKENKLQDPNNKRKIICDESLQALFHVNSIDMFKMNKALSKHIWPLGVEDENVKQKIEGEDCHCCASRDLNDSEKEEEAAEGEEEKEKEEKSIKQRSKRKGSTKVHEDVKKRRGGFTKLCSLSPELQTLVGVPELARTEVVKKLWSYIREKNLQDPKNKQNIICDESLQALFRVNSINMFQMNKALTRHIWPLDEENANS